MANIDLGQYNIPANPKQGGSIINCRRYFQKFTNYIKNLS